MLIAGGEVGWNNQLSSSELYDPIAGTFTAGPGMHATRGEHTAATLLSNGEVLIVGGFGSLSPATRAERYVPASNAPGSFVLTAHQPSIDRAAHSATLLPANNVLLAGGWSGRLHDRDHRALR